MRNFHLPLLLSLIPLGFLAFTVAIAGRDVLVWDEWGVWGELLERLRDSCLQFKDLLAQQNEQRNLPPRLTGLALMPFFHLNRFADYTLNVFLGSCIYAAFFALYRRTFPDARGIRRFGVCALAFFCFSLAQWETFLVGLNLAQLCTTFAIAMGAWLLSPFIMHAEGAPEAVRQPSGMNAALRALGLLGAGFLGSFAIISGLFYWLALLPAMALLPKHSRKTAAWVWAAVGIACWLGYFHGYTAPGHHPDPLSTLAHPVRLAGFFFTLLGAVCVSDPALWLLPCAIGFCA